MQIASDLILAAVVTVAAVTDLRSGRIRNGLVYPAIVVGMLLGFLDGLIEGGLAGGAAGLEDHALAAGVAFAVMLFCYAIGGMGGGDVKLMAAVVPWAAGRDRTTETSSCTRWFTPSWSA